MANEPWEHHLCGIFVALRLPDRDAYVRLEPELDWHYVVELNFQFWNKCPAQVCVALEREGGAGVGEAIAASLVNVAHLPPRAAVFSAKPDAPVV